MSGWYDDGSEEQYQMEQSRKRAERAAEAERLAKCDGCKRKVPINDLGEHYDHSGWISDLRTPNFPHQAFKFTTCANWRPPVAPTQVSEPDERSR
jgi:hypothetical protein